MSSSIGSIYVDGIISGIDTSAIIEQVEETKRVRINQLETRKTEQTECLTEYQSLTSMLIGLGVSADGLDDADTLLTYAGSSSDSSAIGVTVAGDCASGSFDVIVEQLATAEKVSSAVFADDAEALGLSGDIIINGTTITIDSGDGLKDIAANINIAGAGVWATVVDYAEDDHRLILTGHSTGAENAIDMVDANSTNILENLGLVNATTSAKHAEGNVVSSDGLASSASTIASILDLSADVSGTININGTDLAIDLATDSLQDIVRQINDTVTGVTASIETVENESGQNTYVLQITGDAAQPTLVEDGNVLVTLGVLTKDAAHQLQSAQNATLSVDGVSVSRATNSVDDMIDGVTLDLMEANASKTITITVQQDANATYQSISQFVSSYNAIIDNLNAGQSYDADTSTGGTYFGDPAVRLLEDGLHSAVMNVVDALGTGMTLPSQIGLSTDTDGHLVLDADVFENALWENSAGVARMFGTAGEATDAEITYVSASTSTAASSGAGYDVEITQVAAKATASSANLSAGITVDETLTFNGACSVQLTAGMTLTEAVDRLNERFDLYGEKLDARVENDQIIIEHDSYGSRYGFEVSSNLAKGAGGLDVGGDAAGTEIEYEGGDVAGTINGEQATGRGVYLTGNTGNETTDGLMLRVEATSTGSKGTVRISQGIAARMEGYIDRVTNTTNGSITIATQTISNNIDSIGEEITDLEDELERYLEDLRSELSAMESVLAENESLSSYLEEQLASLPTNYYGSD